MQTLRARRAPTTVNTPKKPKPITDEDVLALLEEKDQEIKALATRLQVLEKLVVREPRFGWRNA